MALVIVLLLAAPLLLRQWKHWPTPEQRLSRDLRHWHRSVTR